MAERCKQVVHDKYAFRGRQCERNQMRDGYCAQHHPDAVKARRDDWETRYQEQRTYEQRRATLATLERAVVEAAERWHQADGAYKEFVEREQVANVYDVDRTLVALFGRLEESQSALRSACSALAAARGGEVDRG